MDLKDLLLYGYYDEDKRYIAVLDENTLKHYFKADEIRINTDKKEKTHGE